MSGHPPTEPGPFGQGQPTSPGPGPFGQGQPTSPGPGPQPGYGPSYPTGQDPSRPGFVPGHPQPPYGGPPPPGQRGPGGPYPPGPGGPGGWVPGGPAPKKSGGTKLAILLGAAALAFMIVGVVAVLVVRNIGASSATPADPAASGRSAPSGSAPAPSTSAPAPSTSASVPATSKPSDAVQAYLSALAAGDSATALALGDKQPGDRSLLTDAVLRASNARAPMKDISVTPVDNEYAYQVDATYTLGGETVSQPIGVKKVGNSWKLRDTYIEVDVGYQRARTLPFLVNGVAVQTDKIKLFPGSYAFTSGSKYVDYGSENVVVVEGPRDYPSLAGVQPTLTEAGSRAFISAAESALTKCLKQRKLAPVGCPFRATNTRGYRIEEDSIRWRISGADPFENLRPRLEINNPAVATASAFVQIRGEAKCEGVGTCTVTLSRSLRPTMKMTSEPLKVVWD